MNEAMTGDIRQRTLAPVDLAATAKMPERVMPEGAALRHDADAEARATNPLEAHLAPLFSEGAAAEFRARWNVVQQGFVDGPQNAVRGGDDLVAQVIKSLAETFAEQRATLEGELGSTEALRLALRRYRSFFERLLSI
jgi:hypothetical protein